MNRKYINPVYIDEIREETQALTVLTQAVASEIIYKHDMEDEEMKGLKVFSKKACETAWKLEDKYNNLYNELMEELEDEEEPVPALYDRNKSKRGEKPHDTLPY